MSQPPLFVAHSSMSVQPTVGVPSKPTRHSHVVDALQSAFAPQVGEQTFAVQVTPSPVKPPLHAHENEPVELVQVAFASQPPLFVAHSSVSVQATSGSPVNPAGHSHVVPLQTAFVPQAGLQPVVTAVQLVPSPV